MDDMNLTDNELEAYLDQSDEWSEDWMDNFSNKTVWLYTPNEEESYLRSTRIGEQPTLSALQAVADAEDRTPLAVLSDVVDVTLDDWSSARWEDAIAEYLSRSDRWAHYPNGEEYWEGPYLKAQGDNALITWEFIQRYPASVSVGYIADTEGGERQYVRQDVIDTFIDYQLEQMEDEMEDEGEGMFDQDNLTKLKAYLNSHSEWKKGRRNPRDSRIRWAHENGSVFSLNPSRYVDLLHCAKNLARYEGRSVDEVHNDLLFGVDEAEGECEGERFLWEGETSERDEDYTLPPVDALRQYRRLKEAYEAIREPKGQAPDVTPELRKTYRDEVLKPAASELLEALGVESEDEVAAIESAASFAFDGGE